jgi:predicted nucleic acid-binding Zn ribbon protein
MERAGKFLGGMLRRLERPEAALAWLSSAWPNIVGKILAKHTKPVRCQAGRLEIAADGKAWQKQLESMEKEFCARVNQAWGGNLVREVKFITKPGPKRVSREMDNEHTPFVRRRRS